MFELLTAAFGYWWPMVWPTALLLAVATGLEFAAPHDRYPLISRMPGAFFLVLQPVLIAMTLVPLRELWKAWGIPPMFDAGSLHWAGQLFILVVVIDFFGYCEHRVQHWLWWPVHAVHHSPTELHAANSYAHPLQIVTGFLIIGIPSSLIGTSRIEVPTLLPFILGLQVLLIHAPTRWHVGPLRRILVDNRFHRIHHSTDPRHFNKNFGIIFSAWDQLFGTAYFPAKDEWPETGVDGVPPPKSFTDFLSRPFKMRWLPLKRPSTGPTGEAAPALDRAVT